jgi:hypothetical protein
MAWQSPTITVKWGSYFQADPAEEKLIIDGVVAAAPHTTKRMRMEKLAPVFGIENVEAALEELEEEQTADADRELQATKAILDAEAGAQRSIQAAKPGPAKPGGGGGRPPSG